MIPHIKSDLNYEAMSLEFYEFKILIACDKNVTVNECEVEKKSNLFPSKNSESLY